MSINKELSRIQKELKTPKGQFNSFGKYKYRNCEDILEALKGVLGECHVTLSDEIAQIGDRVYVKATAKISLGDQSIEVSAFAREAQSKKGMDDSQVTGAASSYARKYALNGLFAIDDTKDSDTTNNGQTPKKTEAPLSNGALDAQVEFSKVVHEGSGIDLFLLSERVGDEVYTELYNSFAPGSKVRMKAKCDELYKYGKEQCQITVNELFEATNSGDTWSIRELVEPMTPQFKKWAVNQLNAEQVKTIKEAMQ